MRRRILLLHLAASIVLGTLLANVRPDRPATTSTAAQETGDQHAKQSRSRRVIVSVDETRFNEVESAVQAAGLEIEHRLIGMGMLIGTLPDKKRRAVQAVSGVDCIQDNQTASLDLDLDFD
jgi:hypothetical protein